MRTAEKRGGEMLRSWRRCWSEHRFSHYCDG